MTRMRRARRSGQAIVESALILLVFLATLIGAMDFGQLLLTHQALVNRTREAIRWAVVNQWDGTGDKIANRIRYNSTTVPEGSPSPYFGITRENVQVTYTAGTVANPNDEIITVAIVNYQYKLFSPWIAGSFTNNTSVVESAAMIYRQ